MSDPLTEYLAQFGELSESTRELYTVHFRDQEKRKRKRTLDIIAEEVVQKLSSVQPRTAAERVAIVKAALTEVKTTFRK